MGTRVAHEERPRLLPGGSHGSPLARCTARERRLARLALWLLTAAMAALIVVGAAEPAVATVLGPTTDAALGREEGGRNDS